MIPLIRRIWQTFYQAWMRFAHILGIVNTTILLSVVYVIIVLPMRAGAMIVRKDPLRLRAFRHGAAWRNRDEEPSELRERTHPF